MSTTTITKEPEQKELQQAEAMQEITLRLPRQLVVRLSQAAEQRHEAIENVVATALELSLPPLTPRSDDKFEREVQRLEVQTDEQLQTTSLSR